MDPISKEDFVGGNVDQKLSILYGYVISTDETVKKLEATLRNKKKADTAKTLMGGIIGGAIVMATKLAFWK